MLKPAPPRSILLTFVGFLAVGVLLVASSIHSPFLWDDLHLIRVHTPTQLASVWTGSWDTDHIETPGFRPLTAYFNHFRALAFGESVATHRLFLLLLFAVLLTMTGIMARWLFAATFWQVLLGGLLGLVHIDSVYHYFWISDGIHLLAGILIMGSILAFLRGLSSGRPAWLLLSFFCTLLALLAREDSLTVFPLLAWFGLAFMRMQKDRRLEPSLPVGKNSAGRLSVGIFAVGMLVALSVYWYWRGAAIPNAEPLSPNPGAMLWAASHVVQNAGAYYDLVHPTRLYGTVIGLWYAWLVGLLLIAILLLSRPQKKEILIWAGASLIAVLPLLESARANLLLLGVMFWGFLVAGVLSGLWQRPGPPALRFLAVGMTIFALAAPAYASLRFMQEQRPDNLDWMCEQALVVYTPQASIPEARRKEVQRQLQTYGISSGSDSMTELSLLQLEARRNGRYSPNPGGLPFIPRFDFMPNFPVEWRCLPRLK